MRISAPGRLEPAAAHMARILDAKRIGKGIAARVVRDGKLLDLIIVPQERS